MLYQIVCVHLSVSCTLISHLLPTSLPNLMFSIHYISTVHHYYNSDLWFLMVDSVVVMEMSGNGIHLIAHSLTFFVLFPSFFLLLHLIGLACCNFLVSVILSFPQLLPLEDWQPFCFFFMGRNTNSKWRWFYF